MSSSIRRAVVILSCAGCLFVPGRAAAQGIQAGVEGGLTVTSLANLTNALNFGGPVDVQQRAGFLVGPFVRFPMTPTLALQTELLFATKGASPTDGANELKIQLRYLDVPILVRVQPSAARLVYFVAGPSVNFNVSARTIDVVPVNAVADISDNTNNIELGLVFGAGFSFRRAFVEGRYVVGLTDISDDPALTAAVRNRGFAVLVGTRF
jgi:hypothetical protein